MSKTRDFWLKKIQGIVAKAVNDITKVMKR